MADSNLTIGDVLPENQKDQYSDAVLNMSLKEAMDIAVYNMPPTSDLTSDEVAQINKIYKDYVNNGGDGSDSGSAYWDKSQEENQAYWDKQ